MTIIRYLIDNYRDLVEVAIAVHTIAAVIVNLTPTPRDNAVLGRYYRALEFLAGIITPLAKR